MKTFEELLSDKEEGVEEVEKVKSSKSLVEEMEGSLKQLKKLLHEDFSFQFDLKVEKYKDLTRIYTDNLVETLPDGMESLSKIMFKELYFNAYCETVVESSSKDEILKLVPGMAFKNFEEGNFYQTIGDINKAYYYNVETKEWSRKA